MRGDKMRKVGWLAALLFATMDPGCSCSHTNGVNGKHDMTVGAGRDMSGSDGGDMAGWQTPSNCTPPASLTLTPGTQSAAVAPGGTFTQAFTARAARAHGMTTAV